jgi:putative tricarboxylic transport membrane protein
MELLNHLALGFSVAGSAENLLYCFAGVLLGTLVGVLPGVGPVATISVLLPVTFYLPPIGSLIMLSGIYYGAQYGGSTTAILVNLPGESSSVVTCIDGYRMAQKGRAGAALGIAAIGSFFAGCVSILVVAGLAQPLAAVALAFGPAEYFSLMVVGLLSAAVLAYGSLLKALAMIVLGLLLGLVGTDVTSGALRFTFGFDGLFDGISFVVVALGLFGLAEIMENIEQQYARQTVRSNFRELLPNREEMRASWKAILRGTALGTVLGILPGTGATISSFASYALERKLAKDPSRFGQGAIEGVAGPESANNAAAQTHFIPLLTLGIPPGPTLAVLFGAMVMFGITPGPQVVTSHPDLFWGMITSMWIGNLMLIVLNLPLVGLWVRLLAVPYKVMFPGILVLSCVGVFSLRNSVFDVVLTAGFGLLGYVLRKLRCEPAPLMLGFILGPLMEEFFRRALVLSRGSPLIFVREPLSAFFLLIAAGLVLMLSWSWFRTQRRQVMSEAG